MTSLKSTKNFTKKLANYERFQVKRVYNYINNKQRTTNMKNLVYIADEPYTMDDVLFKTDPETYIWWAELDDFVTQQYVDNAEEWRS